MPHDPALAADFKRRSWVVVVLTVVLVVGALVPSVFVTRAILETYRRVQMLKAHLVRAIAPVVGLALVSLYLVALGGLILAFLQS